MLPTFGCCSAAVPVSSLTRSRIIRQQPRTLSCFRPLAATKTPKALELGGRRFPSPSFNCLPFNGFKNTGLFPSLRPTRSSLPRQLVTPVRSQENDGKSLIDFVRDVVAGNPGPESDKLESKIRRRAEDAIFSGDNRVTVGDVASASGLTIFEAENALKALAADSLATLAVSNKGAILYCFPSNFRATIRYKSLKARFEAFSAATSETSWYFIRAFYGIALIVSIAIIVTAFIVITIAASSSSRDDRESDRSSGGGGGGGLSFSSFSSFSTGRRRGGEGYLFFFDPYYSRRCALAKSRGGWGTYDTNFVQAVFSFVFGDGDPNVLYEEQKWKFVGSFISSMGGVVTAEQLAPCMEVTPEQFSMKYDDDDDDDDDDKKKEKPRDQSKSVVVDESYVLPALIRFQGHPEVDTEGNIVYVFPELQTTAFKEKLATLKRWFDREKTRFDFHPTFCRGVPVEETPWKLTVISGRQLWSVVALGVANLLGVLWLSNAVTIPANIEALKISNLGWILGAMPYLQIYGISFFIVPGVRWLVYQGRNQAIAARNKAKKAADDLLDYPSPELLKRMEAAAEMARLELVTKESAVFRSDKDAEEQPVDVESEAWERKVERRASEMDTKQ